MYSVDDLCEMHFGYALIRLERIKHLARLLMRLPQDDQHKFDMMNWGLKETQEHGCKTTACAGGYAALDPVFQAQGLQAEWNPYTGELKADMTIVFTPDQAERDFLRIENLSSLTNFYSLSDLSRSTGMRAVTFFFGLHGVEINFNLYESNDTDEVEDASFGIFDPESYPYRATPTTVREVVKKVNRLFEDRTQAYDHYRDTLYPSAVPQAWRERVSAAEKDFHKFQEEVTAYLAEISV